MTERARLETAEVTARQLGKQLGAAMPQGWGFLLFLTSFGQSGATTYVSSVQRDGQHRSVVVCHKCATTGEARA